MKQTHQILYLTEVWKDQLLTIAFLSEIYTLSIRRLPKMDRLTIKSASDAVNEHE